MKFSLIVPTINRKDVLERLFKSLEKQTFRDFEVILVDQNPDEKFLSPILNTNFSLQRIRVDSPGTSKAKNIGLKSSKGEIIAFPDDDAWYPENLLSQVDHLFSNDEISVLSTKAIDPETKRTPAGNPKDTEPRFISRDEVWTHCCMISLFFKSEVLQIVGGFDETLGVGADSMWQSGEETDLAVRAYDCGFKPFYSPKIEVYHPFPLIKFNKPTIERGYKYGLGMGKVLRTHNFSLLRTTTFLFRPFIAFMIFILFSPSKGKFYLRSFQGRIQGFFS